MKGAKALVRGPSESAFASSNHRFDKAVQSKVVQQTTLLKKEKTHKQPISKTFVELFYFFNAQ